MLYNIRGANGSGKSTLVRSYITPESTQISLADSVGYLDSKAGVLVVGKYTTDCGGCDTIKTQAAIKAALLEAVEIAPRVIFEGVLVSTIFGPWLDFSRSVGGMVWCYLDTPVDMCLQRIYYRNGGKTINEKLVHDKITSIGTTQRKAVDAGELVVVLDYLNARAQLDATFALLE